MEASQFQNFSIHAVNWALATIMKALQAIGQLQVDKSLSEDEKQSQINSNYVLILNLCHMVVPFLDVVKELFPQHKALIDWIENCYNEAISKEILKPCACQACKVSNN